jgi:hypothetical protein
VAGDSAIIATAEYRFHVPRALGIQAEPSQVFGKPFHWRPARPGGRADWDLILKAFIDGGRIVQNDALQFERNYSLLSTGVGMELMLKQNITLRLDYGVVLRDLDLDDQGSGPDRGDSRLHVVFTLLY